MILLTFSPEFPSRTGKGQRRDQQRRYDQGFWTAPYLPAFRVATLISFAADIFRVWVVNWLTRGEPSPLLNESGDWRPTSIPNNDPHLVLHIYLSKYEDRQPSGVRVGRSDSWGGG